MKLDDLFITEWKQYKGKELAQLVFIFNGKPLGILVTKGSSIEDVKKDLISLVENMEN